MKKFDEIDVYLAILLLFFSMLLGAMIGLGLTITASIESNAPPSPKIYLEVLTVEELQRPLVSSKRNPDLVQTQIAESLYGPDLYRFYIFQIHEQYYPDVDPYVALAVLEIESNYKPNLTSSAGAVGLMQWIPKWHAYRMAKFHLSDMWDPYTNIIVGMDYLNDLYLSTGSWREALYGYNHSTSYVDAVLEKANELRRVGYFND